MAPKESDEVSYNYPIFDDLRRFGGMPVKCVVNVWETNKLIGHTHAMGRRCDNAESADRNMYGKRKPSYRITVKPHLYSKPL